MPKPGHSDVRVIGAPKISNFEKNQEKKKNDGNGKEGFQASISDANAQRQAKVVRGGGGGKRSGTYVQKGELGPRWGGVEWRAQTRIPASGARRLSYGRHRRITRRR